MAMTIASATVIRAAIWPFIRKTARATKKKMIGIAATSADSHKLSASGA
jgi:hypothetical protein